MTKRKKNFISFYLKSTEACEVAKKAFDAAIAELDQITPKRLPNSGIYKDWTFAPID